MKFLLCNVTTFFIVVSIEKGNSQDLLESTFHEDDVRRDNQFFLGGFDGGVRAIAQASITINSEQMLALHKQKN